MNCKSPNIVYIFCDELRADALGCYSPGKQDTHTPNIDLLAEKGIRFENCFCNSPVCVPSRMSLLTGLYPEETGVYQNEASLPPFQAERKYATIPTVLDKNGYLTASFGKTHLPWRVKSGFKYEKSEGSEMNLGLPDFSSVKGLLRSGGVQESILGGLYPEGQKYQPAAVTENALAWIRDHIQTRKQPFFVRISYLQPHTPVIAPQRYETCDALKFSGELGSTEHLSFYEKRFAELQDMVSMSKEDIRDMQRYYYYVVAWIDEQVGKIVSFLDELEQDRETVIILNSDHGVSLGENSAYGKMTFSYCVQRVPLIISGGSSLPRGVCETGLCSNIDLGRTIFGLAGVEADDQFHGRDLLKDGPSGEAYGSIGYGSRYSYPFGYDAVGEYQTSVGWPRRACLRRRSYRLDMNVRMNGKAVGREMEDLFFVDHARCPEENVNMKKEPEYASVIAEMRGEILDRSGRSVEVPDEVLFEISRILKDRSFFRYLIEATKFNDSAHMY